MKKIFLNISLIIGFTCFLQACAIPPSPIKWRTDPGKIQKVNCSSLSPTCSNTTL